VRSVRIINETGDVTGTRIVDTTTGDKLYGVRRAQVTIDVDEPVNRATVELVGVQQDMVAQAEFALAHPLTGEMKVVKSLVFEDGTRVDL
jgi:hypothetical protein